LENRARLLLQVVAAVRDAVGPRAAVAVKLNSADFQRGGFNFDDSLRVAGWLEAAG
ncbi:MAG TPA: NADH:flavin oxidoreductase, partial [Halieaceae bacterium]|nr:NADH:flavin oxidoreductase [Halieaceae bacterium]